MVISPILGLIGAFGFTIVLMRFLRNFRASKVNTFFGKLQIASSAFDSLTHGANDGQKTMGVITALLIAGGSLAFKIFRSSYSCHTCSGIAIALGTFWRMANCKDHGLQVNQVKTISGLLCRNGRWHSININGLVWHTC